MKTIFKISLLALTLSSISAFADVPVLSTDELGNESSTMISDEDYMKVTTLQAGTMALAAEDHLAMAITAPQLTLRGILVGLEATGGIGPGPWKLGAGINQQFFFELKN